MRSTEIVWNILIIISTDLNANPVEDQSLVQQTIGNHCCVKNQPCNEEKHEPSASSFEISQNAPRYVEEIGVSGQEFCDELYSSPFCFDIKIVESQAVDIFNVISEVSYIHGYDKSVVQNHYEDAPIFYKYDDEIEKKDPEMCEVCDMANLISKFRNTFIPLSLNNRSQCMIVIHLKTVWKSRFIL